MPVGFGCEVLVLPAAVASAQATLLAGRSCWSSSEAPVASRQGEAVSPHGLAMKPSASSSGAADVKTHRRRKQGSLR